MGILSMQLCESCETVTNHQYTDVAVFILQTENDPQWSGGYITGIRAGSY